MTIPQDSAVSNATHAGELIPKHGKAWNAYIDLAKWAVGPDRYAVYETTRDALEVRAMIRKLSNS